MQDHGRIIPLAGVADPDRYVEAYAGFAIVPTLAQLVATRLELIRDQAHGGPVQIRSRSSLTLSGLKAQRVVVRYYDRKHRRWMVEDLIEAVRNDVEYSVVLHSKDGSYKQDRIVFERVVASFTR